ncbi:MAG TPA: UDP-glucose--hexose-1-phosphate uridylyltransferase [Ilumatobacteraceae bacterium]|nr:UDP-glucose--hexose-1-phosphate uridylyltransferase [Ilumatobacteraceae bacterium]
MPFDPSTHPHRRRNPLTGRWVIVSPQRTQRPWVGQRSAEPDPAPGFDPGCYLCPGNERAGGVRNPDYDSTFVFVNDFAALLPDAPSPDAPRADSATDSTVDGLFRIAGATGECRVLCFSPRHDLTLADMTHDEVVAVIELWQSQLIELRQRFRWVQIFETRGAISGASNPHPHGQIWASTFLPDEIVQEMGNQRTHLEQHGRPMLLDYVERELELGERIVTSNDEWAVVVPYWAYWPFETLVLPRRRLARLDEVDAVGRESLADVMQTMLRGFDALFDTPFPYCSGWHTAPDTPEAAGWQLHGHYYPPLLRSADVAKIPASYELLANLQRDVTPEAAAAELRAVTPTF